MDLRKPYLAEHFAPVADEIDRRDLKVRGMLPPELNGRYIRNGHNPRPGDVPSHWFRGSGMLHGIRLRAGRAEWYRNRWVRTPAWNGAPYVRADGSVDLTASIAGTHIVEHAGRLLALQEANLPFEVTRELDTVGPYDFAGGLTTAMTAHPKTDPGTGELHFFGYSPTPPYLTYHVASPRGRIIRSEVICGAGPSLMHDFGLTRRHVVWLDLPVVFNPAESSGVPYRWSESYAPRIGVMPRTGPAVPTWFEVSPGMVLHVANAYEDARGRIVLEAPRFDRAAWETSWRWWVGAPGYPESPVVGATSHRWILDPASGVAGEQELDSLVVEFPKIDARAVGRPHRFGYVSAFPGAGLREYAIVKYDRVSGERWIAGQGRDRMPGEAVFVPAEGGTAEDDGYLLTVVGDLARNASELLVLDARRITAPPIAVVELPRRVPAGIHGSWIPDPDGSVADG
ncbi:carotenoid oxygenase family protein [Embleya sp. NPDC020630]|uniref:carotenoid oxygenase family protein n=1 Tax=Embleya sp. NPDC020630 TaxID=3363979 RepID=UPI0037895383